MSELRFYPSPVVLSGKRVLLEPLTLNHASDLYEMGQDDRIWRFMPVPRQKSINETEGWIKTALQDQTKVDSIPFAIIHQETQKAIGSTRYLDIRRNGRTLEIGWTWLAVENIICIVCAIGITSFASPCVICLNLPRMQMRFRITASAIEEKNIEI